jgi:hypothetical protein
MNVELDIRLSGAPNFRLADLNVYGVSQPTIPGLSTILTLLGCHPPPPLSSAAQNSPSGHSSTTAPLSTVPLPFQPLIQPAQHGVSAPNSQTAFWFNTREEPVIYLSGRPFVLREQDVPKQNIRTYAGISADRLEQLESRLKDDIVKEATRCHGLVLVHDELGIYDDQSCQRNCNSQRGFCFAPVCLL